MGRQLLSCIRDCSRLRIRSEACSFSSSVTVHGTFPPVCSCRACDAGRRPSVTSRARWRRTSASRPGRGSCAPAAAGPRCSSSATLPATPPAPATSSPPAAPRPSSSAWRASSCASSACRRACPHSAMQCPACDHENRGERRFCGRCGVALAVPCAACGATNDPGENFCGGCGAPLQPAAPAGSTRAPSPDAALPAGERRQLTVLFCDLVGSTPLAQQLDPEEWRYMVAQYHKAAAGAVERFGGHVAQYLGDGLLVYFGWPDAREDDPERAVRAGLAILDAMGPVNARLATPDGTRLAVRVGMHTGPVVVAETGEVFGETPNLAARVQGAADADTVVVSAATQRLVAGIFVMDDRGPQALKGVRDPMVLYRVVQPSGV